MQDGFFQKVTLCAVIALCAAGFIEFYRHFINGADEALNGTGPRTHMNAPAKP